MCSPSGTELSVPYLEKGPDLTAVKTVCIVLDSLLSTVFLSVNAF